MPSTNAITNITDIDELFARIEEYLAPEQVAFVRKAYELAAKAHAAQTRKSGEPYIIHPIGVVSILVGLQMDDKTLAAAFLHDVVEDTDYKLDYIKEQFGTVVANWVKSNIFPRKTARLKTIVKCFLRWHAISALY